jgi:hypothetical protein
MTNLPEKIIYPTPFAGADGAALATIKDGTDENLVNFADGFPSAYSSPKSNNGKFVTRGELNAIGNLATKNEFYRMCGGINTFDPEFAEKIGGYPEGAILDYFDGYKLTKVISLVGDNDFDFRSGLFGGKWQLLNQDNQTVINGAVIYEDSYIINPNYKAVTPLFALVAPLNGIVNIKCSNITYPTLTSTVYSDLPAISGQGIIGKVSDSIDDASVLPSFIAGTGKYESSIDWKGYKLFQGISSYSAVGCLSFFEDSNNSLSTSRNVQGIIDVEFSSVKKGQIISICAVCGSSGFGTNDYPCELSGNLSFDMKVSIL